MTEPLSNTSCKGIPDEIQCNHPGKKEGFCLLHYSRGKLLELAKEKCVRICDDAKRSCRNETFNNKLKCEDCLRIIREKDNKQYEERKSSNACVMCGMKLEKETKGIKGNPVTKCQECYEKERSIEQKRSREPRNQKIENKLNLAVYYNKYTINASRRNLEFTLSLEKFTTLVESPCYYCKYMNELEANGVDRIDSSIGYIDSNVVPACETCNMMKGSHAISDFAKHIVNLYNTFAKPFLEESEEKEQLISEASPSRRLRTNDIIGLYMNKQLKKYIDLCISDKRSQVYIDKLTAATEYTMIKEEFVIYLKKIARNEVRLTSDVLVEERQRVPRNEIKALLAANKVLDAVKLYEAVWGYTKTIREDFTNVAEGWNTLDGEQKEKTLQALFIKYSNRRNYHKKSQSTSETSSIQPPLEPVLLSSTPFTQASDPSSNTLSNNTPTQWKVSNIWKAFQTKSEDIYKDYLLSNNSIEDFENLWKSFVDSVKDCIDKDSKGAEPIIKKFIIDLRTIRHNSLCYKKNTEKLLARDDRQHWNSHSVLHAFKAGDLSKFKAFTEESTGEVAHSQQWCKRWGGFVDSVNSESDTNKKRSLITKFLTAQRTKKYRENITTSNTSH